MNPFDSTFKEAKKQPVEVNPFDKHFVKAVATPLPQGLLGIGPLSTGVMGTTPTTSKDKTIQSYLKDIAVGGADTAGGITRNFFAELPPSALKVARTIGQGIARTVATVGISAGNIPFQSSNAIMSLPGQKQVPLTEQNLPFAQSIPTKGYSKVTDALFGGEPINTIPQEIANIKAKMAPYFGEQIASTFSTPLIVGSILMDLSGFGGGKAGVKSFTSGEIPEQFFKFIAKTSDKKVLADTYRKIGVVDPVVIKTLTEATAPTKTIEEVKDVFINFHRGMKMNLPAGGSFDYSNAVQGLNNTGRSAIMDFIAGKADDETNKLVSSMAETMGLPNKYKGNAALKGDLIKVLDADRALVKTKLGLSDEAKIAAEAKSAGKPIPTTLRDNLGRYNGSQSNATPTTITPNIPAPISNTSSRIIDNSLAQDSILLHGGPKNLIGGKLALGMGVSGNDAGGIFFSPNTPTGEMYARSYSLKGAIKTGEGAVHQVKLSPNVKIFDANNPKDMAQLRKFVQPEIINDITTTARNGVMDWATGSQYFENLQEAGFAGAKLSERPAGFKLFNKEGKLVSAPTDAISVVVFDNSSFEMLPSTKPLQKKSNTQGGFAKLPDFITGKKGVVEGDPVQTLKNVEKRVGAVNNSKVKINRAEYDSDHFAKKPVDLPEELVNKQISIEIAREALDNDPMSGLVKYASKTGENAGHLPEVTGVQNSKGFKKTGDTMITEILGKNLDSETARAQFDRYVARKRTLTEMETSLKKEIKDFTSSSKGDTEGVAQVAKAEATSLEEQAQQSLGKVPEQFQRDTASLDKMIIDTSTNVKAKVGALDYYRTPDRVLKKIGLDEAAKALRVGYDNYLSELPKQLSVISDWAKQVSKEGNIKIFKWLDGEKNVALNAKELEVAKEIKQYLGEWANRLNLPDDNQISHYITHIFDLGTMAKEFDEDIAKIIKDRVPGSVYDPFLEKRLGAKGYVQDTWRALDAYIKRAVRKANMDPALEILKRDSARLEDSQLQYVIKLGARINMRPTDWDNLLDNTIKQLVGYKFGQRPTAVISGTLRRMIYRGSLGGNISSAIRNLTQGVNTFAKLGTRDTLNGYIKLMNPGMSKELTESGILKESFIQDRTLSSTKQLLQKVDKGLFAMFELAEKINRGSAYFGAKAKALRGGASEQVAIDYAKKMVRDTQFVFGSIDTPVAMQGDIAKTIFQFGSFSQKQTEFLLEMAKNKEYVGIVRYIIAALAVVYTVGQVFNIQGKDFNPLNYFSRFGKPPALALPIEISKAVMNVPDQYGKIPTIKKKIKNITNALKPLVPAGIQIDKTLKGNPLGLRKKTSSQKTTSDNPFNNF